MGISIKKEERKMRGFTLIEVLLVIGIAAVVFTFSAPFALNFYRTQMVEDTSSNVIDALQRARHNSVLQKNDSAFGVTMSEVADSFVLFQGANYASRDDTQDEIFSVISEISFTGLTDLVFAKLTGLPDDTGTTTISYGNVSRGIFVDAAGMIYKVDVLNGSEVVTPTYTITFDANGGTGSMSDQTIEEGASANLTVNSFTRTSYTFAGWATSTDGVVAYADSASYTMGSANVTLYAKWTAEPATWTVDSLTYDNRKKITISNTNVDATLTDFPLLVFIDGDTDIGGISNADGFDHRFTDSDGTTLLKYERESFAIASGAATGKYWVKVPSVSTSAPTDIYIYYRNTDTADGADKTNVWNTDFKGVYHFEDATSSTGTNNGTFIGDASSTSGGKLDNGMISDGRSDGMSVGTTIGSTNNNFTISMWVKRTSGGAYQPYHFIFSDYGTRYTFYIDDGLSVMRSYLYTQTPETLNGSVNIGIGEWHYVVASKSSTFGYRTYIDGNLEVDSSANTGNLDLANNQAYWGGDLWGGANDYSLTGIMDEARFSNIRSVEWIHFEYHNMADVGNDLTWGAEE